MFAFFKTVFDKNILITIELCYIIRFLIVYIVFRNKNALRMLKASFGLENKNMKPSKKMTFL